jgi:hypothetical protein
LRWQFCCFSISGCAVLIDDNRFAEKDARISNYFEICTSLAGRLYDAVKNRVVS